eukprot:144070-Alexandrium_andersonii.AAC.2
MHAPLRSHRPSRGRRRVQARREGRAVQDRGRAAGVERHDARLGRQAPTGEAVERAGLPGDAGPAQGGARARAGRRREGGHLPALTPNEKRSEPELPSMQNLLQALGA